MRKVVLALLSAAVIVSMSACLQTGGVKGEKVQSSAIEKVNYDAEGQVLTLVFERGAYAFSGVPQKVYDGLMASDSKGAYFQQKIKGKYEAKKID